jgi:hypothetical protein
VSNGFVLSKDMRKTCLQKTAIINMKELRNNLQPKSVRSSMGRPSNIFEFDSKLGVYLHFLRRFMTQKCIFCIIVKVISKYYVICVFKHNLCPSTSSMKSALFITISKYISKTSLLDVRLTCQTLDRHVILSNYI